ncbi:MAG: general secretion pathway protein GspB, partial [Gammaproteobacteria bacterium]|nr:general secretion pathway protein GspB [Gammaproteobacteria bacterium]
ILDALRKSDAERQRAVTPGLSDVRYASGRTKRNIWLPILVAVLAVNAVFLAVQFLRRDDAPVAPSRPPAAEAPDTSPPAAVLPAPEPPAADIRPLAREAEFGEPLLEPDVEGQFGAPPGPVPAPVVVEAAEGPPAVDAPTGLTPATPPAAPPAAQPAPQPAAPSRILAGNDLPTAEQLMAGGGLNIPALNLDLHVYSETPAGRFVVINSRKYKEGGRLVEGPTVESITRDGVILSNQGRRFTLSRK